MSGLRVRYRTVILDADSTLSAIEGVDWLAEQRGEAVAATVRAQTDAAMRGELPLEAVYGARLRAIAPDRRALVALADAYIAHLAPGAREVIALGRLAGVRWIIVSGGLRAALLPMAAVLGIDTADVHAVDLYGDSNGGYAGFDEASPLARAGGKPAVVRAVGAVEGPVLAVGDGSTDAELRSVVDAFWAYSGFVRRPTVVAQAAAEVTSFAELWDRMTTD